MKPKIYCSILILLLAVTLAFSQDKKEVQLQITELPVCLKNCDNTIPWISGNDPKWVKSSPTFIINDENNKLKARGWVSISDENILLKIEVKDEKLTNNFITEDIWKGDCIQLGIDARGNGSEKMPPATSDVFGTDDAAFSFALTKDSVVGWLHFTKDIAQKPLPRECTKISYNEKSKTLTYQISLPWKLFKTRPGLYPSIGVAVQVNDLDPNTNKQSRYNWGQGAGGRPSPGLFKKLGIDYPASKEYIASETGNFQVWSNDGPADMFYVVSSKLSLVINASYNGKSTSMQVPGDLKFHRYRITAAPNKLTMNNSPLISSLNSNNGKVILPTLTSNIVLPYKTLERFYNILDSIELTTTDTLFLRHLKSVKALTQTEWARLECYKDKDPRLATATLECVENMIKGFEYNAGKLETYNEGKRSFIFAFISKRDGTLQFYQFMLPRNWDPSKSYPLFVELHGAGNPNALNMISSELGLNSETGLAGYTTTLSWAQKEGKGFHLYPYGRGNSRYVDIGEIDVMEAMKDVSQNFKIDEDHRYLFGFSMGGGGTWSVATRTPDLWAAIGIFSGASRDGFGRGIGKNLSKVPVWISCGDMDFLYGNVENFKNEISQWGNNPKVLIIPGMRHEYRMNVQQQGYEWMTQFSRKRPDSFSFVADKDEHPGIWGIEMKRDLKVSGLPEFNCSIKGDSVIINSVGTKLLKITMGKGGLGLTQSTTLMWNNKQIYRGFPVEIEANETEIKVLDKK
jgi:predicted esterase